MQKNRTNQKNTDAFLSSDTIYIMQIGAQIPMHRPLKVDASKCENKM